MPTIAGGKTADANDRQGVDPGTKVVTPPQRRQRRDPAGPKANEEEGSYTLVGPPRARISSLCRSRHRRPGFSRLIVRLDATLDLCGRRGHGYDGESMQQSTVSPSASSTSSRTPQVRRAVSRHQIQAGCHNSPATFWNRGDFRPRVSRSSVDEKGQRVASRLERTIRVRPTSISTVSAKRNDVFGGERQSTAMASPRATHSRS